MNDVFVQYLQKLKGGTLSVQALSKIVGISRQHIYKIGGALKDTHLQTLRDLILALSYDWEQKDIKLKSGKVDYSEYENYFKKSLPSDEKVNLEVMKELLFSFVGLEDYTDLFKALNTPKSIQLWKYFEMYDKIVRTDSKKLDLSISIERYFHDYEIWSFGFPSYNQILADITHDILYYRIKYRIFIHKPKNAIELDAKYIYETVEAEITKKLKRYENEKPDKHDISGKVIEYWKKDKLRKYLYVYVLPEEVFFNSFRLYNATPRQQRKILGIYDSGISNSSFTRFVQIENDVAIHYRDMLKEIRFKITGLTDPILQLGRKYEP